ncbi:MAG: phosphate ABC transporter permease PstA [Candidatus Methanomethylophilaceae archaeon]
MNPGQYAKGIRSVGMRDSLMRYVLTATASLTVLIIILIIAFIGYNGAGMLSDVSLTEMLFGTKWDPTRGSFGALAVIAGTLLVTLGAIAFAFPVGLAAAVYISEFASPSVRNKLKPICEVFAGIPSVVYGFFGLLVLLPLLMDLFPGQLMYGSSWLAASLLLGVMALPTIISVSEDAIHSVPQSYREASMSMGATKWDTVVRIVVPAAISGISAAVTLGIGRAIGETMAVMMVSGNSAVIPDPLWNVFSLTSTITGTLALEMPEVVVGSTHYSALFMLALILMIMVLAVNLLSRRIIRITSRKFSGEEKEYGRIGTAIRGSAPYGYVSGFWASHSGMVMRVGAVVLTFTVSWMAVSLFEDGMISLAIAAVITAVLAAIPKVLSGLSPVNRQEVAETVLTVNMLAVVGILVVILGYIMMKGLPYISIDFLTQSPSGDGSSGGIFPAIVGTLELVAGTAVLAFPFGILSGIYLAEYAKDTKLTRVIREAIDILNGTPSVVFGLFGMTFLVIGLGMGRSLLAGCLALAFMVVPVIIRTTEEALRTVPNELREASRAMGATKWQTTYKVVLPAAMGGTVTGAILAIGRAAGETAPIMFTAVVAYMPELSVSLMEPVMALPYHLYYLAAEVPGATGAQYGTAAVLLIIVMGLFALASFVRGHYNKKIRW